MTDKLNNIWTRRQMLQTSAVASLIGTLPRWAYAQSSFDWKKYSGTAIDVILVKNPRNELLLTYLQEFKDLTGIDASIEIIPEQQFRQKIVIETASGRPSFDVAELTLTVQKKLAAKGKWFVDLWPMIEDSSLTSPDFDFSDFSKGSIAASTQDNGALDTIPDRLDYFMLYYNKSIFDAKGVALPTSMEDMLRAAAEVNDPGAGIAGFVSRGLKNANVPVWTNLYFGTGTRPLDDKGTLQTTSDESIWSATLYRDLNASYGPPGVVGFNWAECQTTFSQGFAAMWLDSTAWARPLEDAQRSRIVGNVGYMAVPPGPKAEASGVFAAGIGISSASNKREAAWYFLQWMTNKENQARILNTGVGSPARVSPFKNKTLVEESALPKAYFDTLLKLSDIGESSLPNIVPVTEFRDIFGIALANMITGSDPASELEAATEAFRPVLEASQL